MVMTGGAVGKGRGRGAGSRRGGLRSRRLSQSAVEKCRVSWRERGDRILARLGDWMDGLGVKGRKKDRSRSLGGLTWGVGMMRCCVRVGDYGRIENLRQRCLPS